MTPEEATAREGIRYTMAVYNTSGDRGRLDELAATFTEDGVLETAAQRMVGRAAIVRALGANLGKTDGDGRPRTSFVRHNLTTSRVEFVSPTEAQGWTYFLVFSDAGPDHMGTYIDRFRKEGDRWLIASRRVKIHWDSPQTILHAPA
ncbi:MAG TPA: nuclear transport factor 2 family protein [Amycolatopsis sp.]|nr:nuclear transport factor 2 family protein [Amycolatopsis sp.]